jgi:membrane-bound serine protease (ClpP class)
LGKLAITDTDLHPSGWINIDDQRIFVLSEGGFIEKGKKVTILSVDGNRVLVREL